MSMAGWTMRWAGVALGAWLVAPAVPARAQWGATQTIGGGADASLPPPIVVVDGAGNPTVAFPGASVMFAVSGTAAGQWSPPQELGFYDPAVSRAVALAVTPGGTALAAWFDSAFIITATRPPGGAWTVPAPGQPGTWPLPPGALVRNLVAAVDSGGQGAVAWAMDGQVKAVQLVLQSGGLWPAMPENVPQYPGLAHAGIGRGDDGSVILVADDQGARAIRRRPDGTYVPGVDNGPGSRFEELVARASTGTFAAAAFGNAQFLVVKGTMTSAPGSDTTTFYSEAGTAPTLPPGARAGGVGLHEASNEVSAAWLEFVNGNVLRAVTEHAGAVTPVTLPAGVPTSVDAARTSGDDTVVVFTDGGQTFQGVAAHVRTPCAAGQWSAQPTPLDAGTTSGAVGAAAGGNVAAAVWVQATGEVRAAIFRGTPFQGSPCPGAPGCATAAAIPNFADATVHVVSLPAGTAIATVRVGAGAYGVAVNPVDDTIWITNREAHSISRILDGVATDIDLVTLPGPLGPLRKPQGIAFHPAGTRVYVASYDDDRLGVVDPTTLAVVDSVRVGSGPAGVAVGGGGTRVWTANYAANTVSRVDLTATPPRVATSRPVIPRPLGIAESTDGTRVYVSGFRSRRVLVIDAATPRPKVLKCIKVGRRPTGVAVQPVAPFYVFVANSLSGTVSVIDPAQLKAIGEIPTGPLPYGLAVDPTGMFLFVVESGEAGSVLVWNLAQNAAAGRFPVGRVPVALGDFLLRDEICN